MPHPVLSSTVARVARAVTRAPDTDPTDGRLLARFVRTREEPAFAELVRRLGPMVLGVCRRVVGDEHLAEDAFQAVFLVLARRAADVCPAEAVRGWVYGVAVRPAREARAVSARRLARERPVAILPESPVELPDPVDPDVLRALDEEIAGLPDHFRTAIVLCELGGVSRGDVAARLGVPEGTLSSRLARARAALARRLRARGVGLSAAGLAGAFNQIAAASVRPDLTAKTIAGVFTPGLVPAAVAALSGGVLRLMFAQRAKGTSAALGLLAAAFAGGLLFGGRPPGPTPHAMAATTPPKSVGPAAPGPVAPNPRPKGTNTILFNRGGRLTTIDPDGKSETKLGRTGDGPCALSPDGTRLAVLRNIDLAGRDDTRWKLFVRGLKTDDWVDLGVECETVLWSPDGRQLLCQGFPDGTPGKMLLKTPEETFLIDVKTKEKKSLTFPNDHVITDWSRDGRYFLTTRIDKAADRPNGRIYLMNRDGTEHRAVTDGKQPAVQGMLSPDGKRVLYVEVELADDQPNRYRKLVVVELATGKAAPVLDVPLNATLTGFCWSPAGARIAYSWRQVPEGKREDTPDQETESHLMVCDPGGENQKTLVSEKGMGTDTLISWPNWR